MGEEKKGEKRNNRKGETRRKGGGKDRSGVCLRFMVEAAAGSMIYFN